MPQKRTQIMKTERLLKYDKLGRDHWWLTSKYTILSDLLKRCYSKSYPDKMLDIGCGSGVFLDHLKKFNNDAFGLDLNYDILKVFCKRNHDVKTVVADAVDLPFKKSSFDLVTLIDVLEHVDDDTGLITGIKKILNPGGLLLISVPAYNALYGKHDRLYGHKRRYNRKELTSLLEKTGFKILRTTYFQPAFVIPLWFKRKIFVSVSDKDDFSTVPRPINQILTKLLCMEKYFLRKFDIPFGTTLACFCKKP